MKKRIVLLPLLMLVLAACGPATTDSTSGTGTSSDATGSNSSSEDSTINPIVVTGAKLGLTNSYADVASVTVDDVDMGVYQCGDYGDGIQMRYKNSNQSSFFNIEAAPHPIVSIVILHTAAKYTTYAPTLLNVYAGTTSQQTATTGADQPVTSVGVFSYEVTYEASENITFFKIEKPQLDYSAYLTSVTITMAVAS